MWKTFSLVRSLLCARVPIQEVSFACFCFPLDIFVSFFAFYFSLIFIRRRRHSVDASENAINQRCQTVMLSNWQRFRFGLGSAIVTGTCEKQKQSWKKKITHEYTRDTTEYENQSMANKNEKQKNNEKSQNEMREAMSYWNRRMTNKTMNWMKRTKWREQKYTRQKTNVCQRQKHLKRAEITWANEQANSRWFYCARHEQQINTRIHTDTRNEFHVYSTTIYELKYTEWE